MALDVNGSIAVCPLNKERCSIRCAWFIADIDETSGCALSVIAVRLSSVDKLLIPIADRAVVNE